MVLASALRDVFSLVRGKERLKYPIGIDTEKRKRETFSVLTVLLSRSHHYDRDVLYIRSFLPLSLVVRKGLLHGHDAAKGLLVYGF